MTTQQPAPLLFQVTNTDDIEEAWINMLVIGPYGAGKTRLIGSASAVPAMRDVLYLDLEHGTSKTLRGRGIDRIHIASYPALAQALKAVQAHLTLRDLPESEEINSRLIALQERMGVRDGRIRRWRTLGLDPLVFAQRMDLNRIAGVDLARSGIDTIFSRLSQSDWGLMTDQIRSLLMQLRDMPMHTLVTNPVDRVVNPENGNIVYQPLFDGNRLPREINGFFDTVGYIFRRQVGEEAKRVLYLTPTTAFDAKVRLPDGVGEVNAIEDPTMQKLYDLVINGIVPS